MNKLEFYTRLIQKHGLSKEVLVELLSDIGHANLEKHYYGKKFIELNSDGVSADFEEYQGSGRWGTTNHRVSWEDVVKKFLKSEEQ